MSGYDHESLSEHAEWERSVMDFIQRGLLAEDTSGFLKRSFDVFLYHRLQKIIEEEPMMEVKLASDETFRVVFGQTFVDRPYIVDDNRSVRHITPHEARLRDLTYSSVVSVNIETLRLRPHEETGEQVVVEHKEYFKVQLARIPMMIQCSKCNLHATTVQERVRQGECPYDYGGYFVVKGKERVLVAQERINYNIVYVFEQKSNAQKISCVAEIRSMSEETGHSVLIQMKLHTDLRVTLGIAYITQDIPFGIILSAFGCTASDVVKMMRVHALLGEGAMINGAVERLDSDERILWKVLQDMRQWRTSTSAKEFIAQHVSPSVPKERRLAYVEQVLHNELFPHMGISSLTKTKVHFMLHMMGKLLDTHAGRRPYDDRDHIANKRVETAGVLVSELFRTLYKRFIRSMEPQLARRQDVLLIMSRSSMITQGIKHAFSTGNWGIPKSSYMRTGVSQVLSRLTYMATLSHLRRILIPVGKEGKNTKIRQVHPSQVGFICAHETPEGHSAGIVKNMAVMTQVSPRYDPIYVFRLLEGMSEVEIDFAFSKSSGTWTKIFVNGVWFANTLHGREVMVKLRRFRSSKRLAPMVSLSMDAGLRELHIFCDEGRLMRPLFNAKDATFTPTALDALSWKQALDSNSVCWLDAQELDTKLVAVFPWEREADADHVEIHPSLWMGSCVNLIPYPEHTQSPRLCYVASMSKQAIGLFASSHPVRTDTVAHVLHMPEQPIVQTHFSHAVGYNQLTCGNNLIVALCCYTGFNQEDSVIFNQSAIERGLFRSTLFKTLVIEEKKRTSYTVETIGSVPPHLRSKNWNYEKLGSHGLARIGEFVGVGDVVVAKLTVRTNKNGQESCDTSHVLKNGEEGYVDRIFDSVSPDGYRMVKIKIRQVLIPEIGDKVCSRCSQKGTIGITLRHEDMPFTQSGIVPDLIMNPHAIPSRMTLNQLLECIGAKSAVIQGKFRHSTGFTTHSVDILPRLEDELARTGFQRHGNERMTSGITGQLLQADIFIGPTYYQRLKHLVAAKIHARNHGNVQMLCRQPCEGRSKEGGLRFGEMERDALSIDTAITLACGLSIPIQDMGSGGWSVLSWDASSELVVSSRQVEFLDKGMRECYEMVLEDGRKLYPSIRHPFLTSDGRWLRADEIVPNETVLRVSLEAPMVRLDQEVEQCAGWSLLGGRYRTDCRADLLRTMAFARLVGFLMTDGHVSRDGKTCVVWLGHYMDVVAFCEDLETISRRPSLSPELVELCEKSNVYVISLPHDIRNDVLQLEGITRGNKTDQPMLLPSFALDPTCPLPILREFLGGMFGGDGHTCYLAMHRGKRDQLTSVCFSRSTRVPLLSTLTTFFETFVMLLARFGLTNVTLQKPKETSCSKKDVGAPPDNRTYSTTLHIDIEQLIPFAEKIGFRYCYHKSQRLQAAICYFRLRNEVKRQHNWLVERVDALTNFSKIKKENPTKIVGTKKAIQKAVEELKKREPLLHEYAIPSTHDMTDHLIKGTSFGKFASKHFPTADEFLQTIGASSLFTGDNDRIRYGTKRDENGLRAIHLKVLSMKSVGERPVFDIQVDRTESFLADGVVAHNCMISHGVSHFLIDRLFHMSDPFFVPVCSACGGVPTSLQTCATCPESTIYRIPIPYACKLLFQELQAIGIDIRLLLAQWALTPRLVAPPSTASPHMMIPPVIER